MILRNKNGKSEIYYTTEEVLSAAHVRRSDFDLACKLGWLHPLEDGSVCRNELRSYMRKHNRTESEIDRY